jgi:hypothetical protein
MAPFALLLALAVTPLDDGPRAPDTFAARAQLDARISASATNATLRAAVEEELLGVLRRSTNGEARLFAAQRLAVVAGETSLAAWTNLTASAEEAHLACIALTGHPSPKAGEILRGALPSASGLARLQIVNALGRRAEPESVPLLAPLASDPDTTLADAARVALARIPGPAAAAALASAPRLPEADLLRASRHTNAITLENMMRTGATASIRRGAWNALADGDPAGLPSRILAALKEGDPVIAPLAAATAGRLNIPHVTAALAKALPTLSHPARGWLTAALADLPGPEALAALQQETRLGRPRRKTRRRQRPAPAGRSRNRPGPRRRPARRGHTSRRGPHRGPHRPPAGRSRRQRHPRRPTRRGDRRLRPPHRHPLRPQRN